MPLDIDVKPRTSGLPSTGRYSSEGSPSVTRRHVIRLIPEDLNLGDQNLNDFIKFARHVVSQEDPSLAARYGGILYLALVSAFESAGMTKLDWAPALTLEILSEDYEVSLILSLAARRQLTPVDPTVGTCPVFMLRCERNRLSVVKTKVR